VNLSVRGIPPDGPRIDDSRHRDCASRQPVDGALAFPNGIRVSTDASALQAPAAAAIVERRPVFRGAWLLSGSMLLSGLLIYVFHVLAARALGPAAYGQIAVLWAAMFLAVIVLFRPIEQTLSRALADRLARGEEVATVLRSVTLLAAAIVVLLGAGVIVGWNAIGDRLFLGDSAMTALLVAGIAGYGLAYVVRGVLAGVRWFNGYGASLVVDAFARLAIAAPLLVVASKLTAATAVVAAGAVGALIPLWVGRARVADALHGSGGTRFELGSALAFAAPASVIAVSDQLLVNGGSLLVMVEGGDDASRTAGIVFAATMLVRVPTYVFQGFAASLLPNLTHLNVVADAQRFRRAVAQATGILFLVGAAIVVAAALLGPESMRVLYGSEFEAGRTELVLLGAGVGCYLASSTLSQALLALDAGSRAAGCWAIAAVLFVGLYAAVPGGALMRIAVAFAVATLVNLVALGTVTLWRPPVRDSTRAGASGTPARSER
jgi:O-antigen/teichoic acid export membrane protein